MSDYHCERGCGLWPVVCGCERKPLTAEEQAEADNLFKGPQGKLLLIGCAAVTVAGGVLFFLFMGWCDVHCL